MVQYVLELGHVEAMAAIMRQLCGHYADLAQQKFSSNVVEKCLKLGGPGLAELRERVIRELLTSPLLHRLLQARRPAAPGRAARAVVSCTGGPRRPGKGRGVHDCPRVGAAVRGNAGAFPTCGWHRRMPDSNLSRE